MILILLTFLIFDRQFDNIDKTLKAFHIAKQVKEYSNQ